MQNPFKRFFKGSEAPGESVENDNRKVLLIHTMPEGTTGSENYAGYASEDYLQEMRGTQRADKFDEMRRTDAQISMITGAVVNPIKAASWDIEPGDDSPESKADAELMKHLLFCDMEKPWEEFIEEALTLIPFGHSVFEIIHKVVIGHPKFGNYNGLRQLGWRSPRTIERWNLDKESGLLESISQQSSGDLSKLVDMDARFLLVFSHKKEGSNYEGISMLRPCYGNFVRKKLYQKLNAIGIEKFAVPTPIAEVPDEKQYSEQYVKMKAVLQSYTTHQNNFITKPKGWDITLHSNAYDPEKVENSIDREDLRMAKAFLANFLELGTTGTGSYSLGSDLSDFFLGGIEAIANLIASGINRKLIKDLVILNRGPREVYPKLVASGISDKAGEELAKVLDLLVRNKILTPDDRLEDNLRKRFKLPEKSLVGQRHPDPVAAPGPGVAPTPTYSEGSILHKIRLAEKGRRA